MMSTSVSRSAEPADSLPGNNNIALVCEACVWIAAHIPEWVREFREVGEKNHRPEVRFHLHLLNFGDFFNAVIFLSIGISQSREFAIRVGCKPQFSKQLIINSEESFKITS